MTEWGLVAAYGIPTAAIMGIWFGYFWRQLGNEPHEPMPKHPHTIQYLAERERRMQIGKGR